MSGFTAANSSPARADGSICAQQDQIKRRVHDSDRQTQARNPFLTEHLGLEPPPIPAKSSRSKVAAKHKAASLPGQTIPQKRSQNAATTTSDPSARKRVKSHDHRSRALDDSFNVAKPGTGKTLQQAQEDAGSGHVPAPAPSQHKSDQAVAGFSESDLNLVARARSHLSQFRYFSEISGPKAQTADKSGVVAAEASEPPATKSRLINPTSSTKLSVSPFDDVRSGSAETPPASLSQDFEAQPISGNADEEDVWSFDEVSLSDVELEQEVARTDCKATQASLIDQSTEPRVLNQAAVPELHTPLSNSAPGPPGHETRSIPNEQQRWDEVDDIDDTDFIHVEALLDSPSPLASLVPGSQDPAVVVPVTKPCLSAHPHTERTATRRPTSKQTAINVYEDVDVYDEDDDQIFASLLPHFPSSSAPPSRPSSPTKPMTPLKPSSIHSTPIEMTDLTDVDFPSTAIIASAACSQPYRPLTLSGRQASSNPYHWSLTAPIVRPPFPGPVSDRSHIHGVSSSTVLRTCFRLGEALNVGCNAARHGQNVVIELYARVASSHREVQGTSFTGKQFFMLRDVFHEFPPCLQGVFEGWLGCQLLDDDAGAFLGCGVEEDGEGVDADAGVGKLCRAVGRMSREGKGWIFVMSSVWEAGWEDVEAVRQVVCS